MSGLFSILDALGFEAAGVWVSFEPCKVGLPYACMAQFDRVGEPGKVAREGL